MILFPNQDDDALKLNTQDLEYIRVHSIESFGTQDGPGIRMVLFTQGCQFRCLYCQNADTLDVNGGQLMSIDDLVKKAIRCKPYFKEKGGVTVSGGEPLLQRAKLTTYFKRLHAEGINTCLDTNGRVIDDSAKELLKHTDLVLLDIKHIDDTIHKQLTGLSNSGTLKFADYCEEIGKEMWLRHVLVPGYCDKEEYLEAWAKRFANFKSVTKVEIIPYHKLGAHKWEHLGMDYQLKDTPNPTKETLEKALNIFNKYLKNVVIK